MDYKEKYNAALERARQFSEHPLQEDSANIVEYIFPELNESEDELTWLTKYIEEETYSLSMDIRDNEDLLKLKKLQRSLAWLEKQGEQTHVEIGQSGVTKTSDQELEPKFHPGDWIIANDDTYTYQVREVKRGVYVLWDSLSDKIFTIGIEGAETSGRLWTIQDARDGDVLATEDKNFTIPIPFIAIYKSLGRDNLTFNSHYFIGFDGNVYEGEDGHTIEGIHPATKEQRDLLFQKMKEAGYEWNAEKKELKKIEHKTLNADEVIEWLNHRELMSNEFINRFKKYFGL